MTGHRAAGRRRPGLGGVLVAALRLHLALLARRPVEAVALLTTPLLTIIFSSIGRHNGRDDFVVAAVLGAGLIGVWVLAVNEVGELVASDRWFGTLELLLAAPVPLPVVILGRLCAVVAIGSLAFVESYVVGVVVFGASLPIHHPAEFALALLGVLVAILGTACLLAPLFVLSRVTVMFEVLLTYPFYILGAVLFPVELLPHWLRPVSDLVFLRWGADLLRSTAAPGPVHEYAARLLLVVGFGVASYALGSWLTARAVATVKVRGTAVLA